MLKKTGANAVVALVRDDSWDITLYEETEKNFGAMGGKMVAVKYDPQQGGAYCRGLAGLG